MKPLILGIAHEGGRKGQNIRVVRMGIMDTGFSKIVSPTFFNILLGSKAERGDFIKLGRGGKGYKVKAEGNKIKKAGEKNIK